jgi:hypothetical protein
LEFNENDEFIIVVLRSMFTQIKPNPSQGGDGKLMGLGILDSGKL